MEYTAVGQRRLQELFRQLEEEIQSDRQLQCADAADINQQTGRIQELTIALKQIAGLWPDPDVCAELVPEWVGPHDGKMRAAILWFALNYARKALDMPQYERPAHWDKPRKANRSEDEE